MKFTATQIAQILDGSIVGNPNAEVFKLSKIEDGQEGSLSFLSNAKYTNHIYTTQASVVIVNNSFEFDGQIQTTLIKVEDAYSAFAKILEFYNAQKNNKTGIDPQTYIAENVKYDSGLYLGAFSYIAGNVIIGKNVKIHPNCFIGENVVIGDNVSIFAGAKIHSESEIGNNSNIYSGAIIGADGFGFAPQPDGSYSKIPQIGIVIIEENVDIGANTTIDRATMGATIIRKGAKLDNLIHIGHNCEIGENTVIAGQSGVAGSTKIGKNCMIGGQVGFAGHLTIGDNVRIQGKSGVIRNVKDGEVLQGNPAFGYTDYFKSYSIFRNLPKQMAELRRQISELSR
jgi:UDP-3-O-[3-hydroxymyristoyl] glucosamine N-acyltransferase